LASRPRGSEAALWESQWRDRRQRDAYAPCGARLAASILGMAGSVLDTELAVATAHERFDPRPLADDETRRQLGELVESLVTHSTNMSSGVS